MGFHAFPNVVTGGFVGVDVFFVISGYLITATIAAGLADNRFTFAGFYARRIKRIFPALAVVLCATVGLGWFTLFAAEFAQLGKHVGGAAAFISNFVLWSESGYFDTVAESKPLLHLWSLGIEEQFYILWPLIVWAIWSRHLYLIVITAVLAVASFLWNVADVSGNATAAFYSPQTRAWELLIGAIPALWRFTQPKALPGQSVWGALLVVAGIVLINKTSAFPGWWALLPTLGTVLMITAGPGVWLNRVVLAWRPLVWIGLISYPLYLWHWPLLFFARTLGAGDGVGLMAALALSFVFAWATYQLLEKPIRFGRPLRAKVAGLVAAMIAVGVVGYAGFIQGGFPARSGIAAAETALTDMSWTREDENDALCHKLYPRYNYCRIAEDRPPTVALLGDSHANHFFPGLAAEFQKRGENLVMLGAPGCPPLADIISRYAGDADVCTQNSTSDALKEIAADPAIHTVVLAGYWHLYITGTGFSGKFKNIPPWQIRIKDNPLQDNGRVFESEMGKTLALLAPSKKVIVLKQAPELGFDPKTCAAVRPLALHNPVCSLSREAVAPYLAEYERFFDGVLEDFPGVTVWDPQEAFCDADTCLAMVDNKPLYRDEVHLSRFGSMFAGQRLFSIYGE